MKRLASSLLVLLCAASSPAAAAGKFDACSLLTHREIEEVQGDRVASEKGSEPQRESFTVSQCFYSLATFSKSISLEVTRRGPGKTESPRAHWKQMFFRAMEKLEGSQPKVARYVSTHPASADRLQTLSAAAAAGPPATVKLLDGYDWSDIKKLCAGRAG